MSQDTEDYLTLAWANYDIRRFSEAIDLARRACGCTKQRPDCAAALAWFLLENGEQQEAEVVLRSAIMQHPNFATLHWYMGVLQFRQKRLEEARRSLTGAVELDPNLDEAAVSLAWVLHDMGRIDEATIWSRIAISHQALPARLGQLGWLLLLQERFEEAVGLLQNALSANPALVDVRSHLVNALRQLGRLDDAGEILQQGLDLTPDDPDLMLEQGWLYRHHGQTEPARAVAQRLVRERPELATGWHLLGVILHEGGHLKEAEQCFAEVQVRDQSITDAIVSRATIQRELNRLDDAASTLDIALGYAPKHRSARTELINVLIEQGNTAAARPKVHELLREDPHSGAVWYLLAKVLLLRHRRRIAKYAIRRASRLAPENSEIWRLASWVSVEDGDLSLARSTLDRLLQLSPDELQNRILAVFVLEAAGEMEAAENHAEWAVAKLPTCSEAWCALAKVRYRQNRLQEAEKILLTALELEPQRATNIFRQLGWVLTAANRLDDAQLAFSRAVTVDDEDILAWLDLAKAQRRIGHFAEAEDALAKVLHKRPNWPEAVLELARTLIDQGTARWDEAVSICVRLLLKQWGIPEVGMLIVRLAAHGHPEAQGALRLIERRARVSLYGRALLAAQGGRGNGLFCRLAALANRDIPEDAALATTAYFGLGLDETSVTADIPAQGRRWYQQLVTSIGAAPPFPLPVRPEGNKLRVAYVAAHLHRSLLTRVLAAHDDSLIEVHLYCDVPRECLEYLCPQVTIHPLSGRDLAASMFANRIDIAVDTVGVHPFLGQAEVLRQFAKRIAPVQCAWLGSWATGIGLFDVLIADEASVPPVFEHLYDEEVVRLPGGQWCWDPPTMSPDPGPPPCLKTGEVTFGSVVRGLRLTRRTLEIWARLLAQMPNSQLEILGTQHDDWQFRQEFAHILKSHGVDPRRIRFHPHRDYQEYLAFYNNIDIALDAFPANGGLCLLDALWMGVPLVTRPGTLLGERQGLSLLESIGHREWAGRDDVAYFEIALTLAHDVDTLSRLRRELRQEILASPLVDGRRLASALEVTYTRLDKQARGVAAATSTKERAREVARLRFATWCEKQAQLDISGAATSSIPDVSVIIVLFNQAGLSLQALTALADQTGVSHETIIIDNASSDGTDLLLDRLVGARVVRNDRNIGFLRAANQGAGLARGRQLLFLNNDAVLHADALFHSVHRLDSEADIGAVGGKVILGDGTLQEAGCMIYRDGSTTGYGRRQDPSSPEFGFVRNVDFCSGVFLMVRRALWQRLNGFDEGYAPAYYEDTDLCLRIWDAGSRVVYEPRAVISHLEWGSATSDDQVIALMEQNRNRFRLKHQNRLDLRSYPAFAKPTNDRWMALRRPRILVVDNAVPHMAMGGGLPRSRTILYAMNQCDVTLFPLWTSDEDWREVYASIPATVEVMLGRGASGLERFLEERINVYDMIFVSRPPNMALIDALWSRRPHLFRGMQLIYDAEAIFALREISRAVTTNRPMARREATRLLRTEMALVKRARTVLAVSQREASWFRRFGVRDVRILSHSMATRDDAPGFEYRRDLLFVGALNPDTPNEDGLVWFVQTVLPLLHDHLGEVPVLNIVGECHSAKIAAMAANGVRLVGRVEDLTQYYDKARVFIAPTRYAAGIPAKVIEAACNGIPIVASRLLVRQLAWSTGLDILAAADAPSFAAEIARLYLDNALWLAVRDAAQLRTRAEVDPSLFAQRLRTALAEIGMRTPSVTKVH